MIDRSISAHRGSRFVTAFAALCATTLLGGCGTVVMNPAGDVARQQANLILWSVGLMLLIIVPVMVLTVLFAWRYRATNDEAAYEPDWDHSTGLELVIWSAPLLIIIALGALTWVSTHVLDPARPLVRTGPHQPGAANRRPLEIEVVSLDWKWLFIYPEQGIATVNELVIPAHRQVRFRMTSSTVMNTFWVPAMAGMIYTMPGMETTLHGVMDRPGRYEGLSGNYSGAGFSDMRFWTHTVSEQRFAQWSAGVKRQALRLDLATYRRLERPSEKVRPIGFGSVDPALYQRIVAMCTKPGVPCAAHGGGLGTDRPPLPGEAKGAITREPGEKGSSPHMTAPHGKAEGQGDPGDQTNRNLTRLDPRALPGAPSAATTA